MDGNTATAAVVIAVLGSAGLWSTILGIFNAIWQRRNSARDDVRNQNAAKIARIEERMDKAEATNAIQNEGIREILHVLLYKKCSDLLTAYASGSITHITTEQLQEVTELYEIYKKLGGNGTGKILYEKVKQIPLRQL